MTNWLQIERGRAPLILLFPHTGTEIPPAIAASLTSAWLARKDTDWWVHQLYDFAPALGATTIRTSLSRSVIDVNRDPSGASLYPGQATTELCPSVTFDGEPLYKSGMAPDQAAIAARRLAYFDPYHSAITAEIARLRQHYPRVVVYDAHSIRSRVPRLFDGLLPQFNIGSNRGSSCDTALTDRLAAQCAQSAFDHVVDGRFVGGWTTRHYGQPAAGVHAVQMELAARGYLDEPMDATPANWPPVFDPDVAAPLRTVLVGLLQSCIQFALSNP